MKGFIEIVSQFSYPKKMLLNIKNIKDVLDISNSFSIPCANGRREILFLCCIQTFEEVNLQDKEIWCIDTYEEIKQKIKEAQGE